MMHNMLSHLQPWMLLWNVFTCFSECQFTPKYFPQFSHVPWIAFVTLQFFMKCIHVSFELTVVLRTLFTKLTFERLDAVMNCLEMFFQIPLKYKWLFTLITFQGCHYLVYCDDMYFKMATLVKGYITLLTFVFICSVFHVLSHHVFQKHFHHKTCCCKSHILSKVPCHCIECNKRFKVKWACLLSRKFALSNIIVISKAAVTKRLFVPTWASPLTPNSIEETSNLWVTFDQGPKQTLEHIQHKHFWCIINSSNIIQFEWMYVITFNKLLETFHNLSQSHLWLEIKNVFVCFGLGNW